VTSKIPDRRSCRGYPCGGCSLINLSRDPLDRPRKRSGSDFSFSNFSIASWIVIFWPLLGFIGKPPRAQQRLPFFYSCSKYSRYLCSSFCKHPHRPVREMRGPPSIRHAWPQSVPSTIQLRQVRQILGTVTLAMPISRVSLTGRTLTDRHFALKVEPSERVSACTSFTCKRTPNYSTSTKQTACSVHSGRPIRVQLSLSDMPCHL